MRPILRNAVPVALAVVVVSAGVLGPAQAGDPVLGTKNWYDSYADPDVTKTPKSSGTVFIDIEGGTRSTFGSKGEPGYEIVRERRYRFRFEKNTGHKVHRPKPHKPHGTQRSRNFRPHASGYSW
jgi:hypothetical protein